MTRCAGLAAALLITVSSSATATVLTKDNAPLLCPPPGSGSRTVDPDRLAHFITTRAGAEFFLDGANPIGQQDGVIQLRSSATSTSEPVYAVRESGRATVGKPLPFGPKIDLDENAAAMAARNGIMAEMTTLIPLMDNGSITDGPVEYRLERRTAVGTPPSRLNSRNPVLLFAPNPPFAIVCHEGASAATASVDEPSAGKPPAPSAFGARVVLRGAVKDLSIDAGDLKDATPASIAFDRDKVADTRAFKINGILGAHFSRPIGDLDLIPYVSYEHTAATGSDNDVEKLSPGLLLAHRIETPSFALHSKLEGSLIYDLRQHSRQGKLRIISSPRSRWGRAGAFCSGATCGLSVHSGCAPISR